MKDDKNFKWTMEDIAHQYKLENPEWAWRECWDKASLIYKELKRLNKQMWDNNKRFFNNNLQFSAFEERNSEFEEIYHDWTS